MKRLFGMVLLSSALLLSNNNSVEASNSKKDVQFQQVYKIEFGNFIDKGFSINKPISTYDTFEWYRNLIQEQIKSEHPVLVTPSEPEAQPVPEENVTPSEPEAQPVPEENVTPSEPEAQPVPEENGTPSEPEAQPVPEENGTPSEPEVQPVPEENGTPSEPEVQPVPEENGTPSEPEVNQTPTTPADNTSVSAIEQAVLNLTNVERQKSGLSALQADSKLMESARAKSVDMSAKGYFSHTSPTYGSPFDQMKQFGVSYKTAGENIAQGQRTAEEVVKAWMESPGHRENILKSSYTHIGIGYDANGNYWTQQFIQK